ncbi:PilE-like protein [Elusimicrobium minutum Pei191]|uniref:PilE-like protein n=1 Tax=Elusimicrobium minutum (strain Pei191) TaxID=445932 RepID=B2KEA4_ELUMP|nr:type II secretion system protein [Elusimicrobium minutum]ACC98850.1 PilE-like protein [Elusimicrobium minutum Pei191]
MKINKKAFTLIEILIVMVIVAVLAAIALPKYIDTVDSGLAKKAYDAMQMVYAAQLRYSAESPSGAFTKNFKLLDVQFPSATISGTDNNKLDFNKFALELTTSEVKTVDLEHIQLVLNFQNQTKRCNVTSASNVSKGQRVCVSLGGMLVTGQTKIYNLP